VARGGARSFQWSVGIATKDTESKKGILVMHTEKFFEEIMT
jgi:hypothetical protein